jgi:hypothetical protein
MTLPKLRVTYWSRIIKFHSIKIAVVRDKCVGILYLNSHLSLRVWRNRQKNLSYDQLTDTHQLKLIKSYVDYVIRSKFLWFYVS